MATVGFLSEMFCSIQGEGPFVGERQVFVRTAGCAEACSWCDTVYSKVRTPRFVIHDDDTREKRSIDNPVPLERAVAEVREFVARHRPVDTVSLTGGEPLEQAEFTRGLARELHDAGLRVYLETNGVHAGPLASILPYVDVIAMDVKLPSAVGAEKWDEHRAFLGEVAGTAFDPARGDRGKSFFVKIVMDDRSGLDEIGAAAGLIAALHRSIPLVLQAESGTLFARADRARSRRLMERMGAAQRLAGESLDNVRIMPQLHKILEVR